MARIPIHVLAIRLNAPALAGTQLLKTLADHPYQRLSDATAQIARKQSLWRDTRDLGALLQIADASQTLTRCSSFAALERLHDRWMRRVNRDPVLASQRGDAFPPPPFPGTTAIEPILNAGDLAAEGRQMRHCVASYAQRVSAGRCYLYRMLEPERATIEIVLDGAVPTLGQFKRANNAVPGQAAWDAVDAWLREHRPPADRGPSRRF